MAIKEADADAVYESLKHKVLVSSIETELSKFENNQAYEKRKFLSELVVSRIESLFAKKCEDEEQMWRRLSNKAQEELKSLLDKIKDAEKELQRTSKLSKDELVLENERLRKELLVPANLYYVSFQFEHKQVIQAPNAGAVELWSRKHGGWFHSGSPLIQSFYFTTVDENGDPVQS
jgi:hypothetical protein